MIQVILKPRKARPFYARHPWVLESAIARIEGSPADGEAVDLLSDKGEFIARGLFNGRSRIHVRLYSWRAEQPLDDVFWRDRLEAALRLRKRLGYDAPEGAARLVFSEADGLSGLIVDRYGRYLVMQVTALAMAVRLPQVVPMLVELAQPRGIFVRTEKDIARAEGLQLPDGPYWGDMPEGPVLVREHDIRYAVALGEGQKTGFYLDQRENRRAAAAYLREGRVLDMFCYTGGFSLAAAKAGAQEVLGVDASQKAVLRARENAELNGLLNVRFETGEAFQTLQALAAAGEQFDAVVLDPPKFARSRTALDEAIRAYQRLNRLALAVLRPGGTLVTCSCSGHVLRDDFFMMLQSLAAQSRRDIQVLDQRGAAPDHPVAVTCPETEYLKCFICRVM